MMILCVMGLLSACSVANFEFSTSQDDTQCLKENPSQNCKSPQK